MMTYRDDRDKVTDGADGELRHARFLVRVADVRVVAVESVLGQAPHLGRDHGQRGQH